MRHCGEKKSKTQFKNTFKLKRKTSGFGKMQSTGILLPIALDYSLVTFLIFLLFYFRYQLVAIMETHSRYKWTSLWKIFQARLKRQRESFPLYLFSLLYIHFPLQYSLSWIFFSYLINTDWKALSQTKASCFRCLFHRGIGLVSLEVSSSVQQSLLLF